MLPARQAASGLCNTVLSKPPALLQVQRLAFRQNFSTSPARSARKGQQPKADTRIKLIRYHLSHALTPRPLRFSRLRALRHWTIHRAWQLHMAHQRRTHELELERQYQSMHEACEALRLLGEDGLKINEPMIEGRTIFKGVDRDGNRHELDVQQAAQRQTEVGKLYRIAMNKTGMWDNIPIEYARAQTETPPRTGWNHGWKR